MRILLIEDDKILADRLLQSLTQRQYVVDAIADGQEGFEYAQSASYDLIISDVRLPRLDGISLCSRLRKEGSTTPILLMTAKDSPDERIRGLDAGADDHLTKPLNLEEMHARVRALLRRGEVAPETVLQAGDLLLDPVSCQVTYGEKLLKLTPKEYSLLELFMRSPNRVFSRSHIIEHLWSFDDPPLEDSVKAHIKGLRRKLKQAGAADWIDNVYGIGYRFTPHATGAPSGIAGAATATAIAPSPTAPSPSLEPAFKESMAGLWGKYQGLMTERIEALTQAAEAIAANSLTPEGLATATTAAHKLAGVLGMFELDEGSDLARELEGLLESQPERLAQVPALVRQLVGLIQSFPTASSTPLPTETGQYSLMISLDPSLAEELASLGQATSTVWQRTETIDEAAALIQRSPPDLVVVDIAAASLWASTVAFVQQLSHRAPAIPTIALTTTDNLIDRVAIAQAGLQRLLMKPATAAEVWAAATQVKQRTRQQTAQILAVDDDPLVLKALRPLLEPWGLGVIGLEKPTQFWDILQATQPDLAILDVEMPEFTGIELCQAVRTDPHWQNLPVLFLTSHRDAATVQSVFQAGADDFISKPIIGPELLTRILNRLERTRLLQTLSHQDSLTGLPNYPHSKQALTRWLETAQTQGEAVSLALIRVADWGAIAHPPDPDAQYAILQAWGQCFQAFGEDIGILGYWGNGEFIIGLNAATPEAAQDALNPLLQALRRQIITLPTGERLQPATTCALASYPAEGQTVQGLYRSAIAKL